MYSHTIYIHKQVIYTVCTVNFDYLSFSVTSRYDLQTGQIFGTYYVFCIACILLSLFNFKLTLSSTIFVFFSLLVLNELLIQKYPVCRSIFLCSYPFCINHLLCPRRIKVLPYVTSGEVKYVYLLAGTHILRGCRLHDKCSGRLCPARNAHWKVYDVTEPMLGLYNWPSFQGNHSFYFYNYVTFIELPFIYLKVKGSSRVAVIVFFF